MLNIPLCILLITIGKCQLRVLMFSLCFSMRYECCIYTYIATILHIKFTILSLRSFLSLFCINSNVSSSLLWILVTRNTPQISGRNQFSLICQSRDCPLVFKLCDGIMSRRLCYITSWTVLSGLKLNKTVSKLYSF